MPSFSVVTSTDIALSAAATACPLATSDPTTAMLPATFAAAATAPRSDGYRAVCCACVLLVHDRLLLPDALWLDAQLLRRQYGSSCEPLSFATPTVPTRRATTLTAPPIITTAARSAKSGVYLPIAPAAIPISPGAVLITSFATPISTTTLAISPATSVSTTAHAVSSAVSAPTATSALTLPPTHTRPITDATLSKQPSLVITITELATASSTTLASPTTVCAEASASPAQSQYGHGLLVGVL